MSASSTVPGDDLGVRRVRFRRSLHRRTNASGFESANGDESGPRYLRNLLCATGSPDPLPPPAPPPQRRHAQPPSRQDIRWRSLPTNGLTTSHQTRHTVNTVRKTGRLLVSTHG
jgi:hypothetical protein